MRTVHDVKKALDPDLMVNMVREIQAQRDAEKRGQTKAQTRKPRQRKNRWFEIFPACSCR